MGPHIIETLQLTSPAFKNNGRIPEKYTCDGEDVHPPLQFSTRNPEVQSFVLIVDSENIWQKRYTHWLLWNINANTSKIEEGALPTRTVEGINSQDVIGYTGPGLYQDLPAGKHRYHFRLYALDTYLALPESTTQEVLEQVMQGHILEQAELNGIYENSQQGQNKSRILQTE